VKRELAHHVVRFLSLSPERSHSVRWDRFRSRDWQRTLPWLHENGLALYFRQRLKDSNREAAVPDLVWSNLERNFAANRKRITSLANRFERLNREFERAGVTYAAVKGFSLVPDFCPDSCLRPQSDFDYVIQEDSLLQAQRVLAGAGYSLKAQAARDYEFQLPGTEFVPTAESQYSSSAPHTVELHLSLWDSNARDIVLPEPAFSSARTVQREWQGLSFSALREEDLFLFLVMHIFYHISNYWLRISWLYEIAYFLQRRATDECFWAGVADSIGDDPQLREITGCVAELAARFFAAPLPDAIVGWQLRPAVKIWIERYSEIWAFGKNHVDDFSLLPTAKLTLFLLQQYAPDAKRFIRSRLFPATRLSSVASALKTKPSRLLDSQFRRRARILRRTFFHTAANFRFLCEAVRWQHLNRIRSYSPVA